MKRLKRILKDMESAVIAFSGGLDSAFLLKAALDSMGKDNVLAVTARSETFPQREYAQAKSLARVLGARLITIRTNEADDPNFIRNPVNRCYYCKKELFGRLRDIAGKKGFSVVIDGSNYDDRRDMRYGTGAAKELGIRSPLDEARICKDDIRRFSRQLKLPTRDKPSFACLASRFPHNHKITKEKLRKVDSAEEFLYKQGFRQVRVRVHKSIARIEVLESEIKRISVDPKLRKEIAKNLKKLGFRYVALDLEGYRTGSMNAAQ